MKDNKNINSKLKEEADMLLREYSLFSYLEKYGKVDITGSYSLDLMVWRDLDLYVDVSNVSLKDLYDIVSHICQTFEPVWCEFKDTRNDDSGCPKGYFCGFETDIIDNKRWNVDIWFTDTQYIHDNRKYIDGIILSLDDIKREAILDLKSRLYSHPGYCKDFFSVDIYSAVINGGVTTEAGFWNWRRSI